MRKVTKILVKLLSTAILLLIILPLVLSLALSLPRVQNFVVDRAARFATSYMGSKVEVGEVKFNYYNNFTINDFLVEDVKQDTMIFVKSADISIGSYSPSGKSLVIKSATLNGGELNLRELSADTLNLKLALDKITKEGSQFRTHIEEIEANDLRFSYKRLKAFNPVRGVDLGDMLFEDIDASISGLTIFNGITELSINRMNTREKSGLMIEDGSLSLMVTEGYLSIYDMVASTVEGSRLNIPTLIMSAPSWEEFKDFERQVDLELTSVGSTLTARDVAYFAPELYGRDLTLREVDLSARGRIAAMNGEIENASFGKNSHLQSDFTLVGLPEVEDLLFDIDLKRVTTDVDDIDSTLESLKLTPLEGEAHAIVQRLGTIALSVKAKGSPRDMELNAVLNSWLGEASYVGDITSSDSSTQIVGDAAITKLNLGNLLNNSKLGDCTASTKVNATLAEGDTRADLSGIIESVVFNSCVYQAIDFDTLYDDDKVTSDIFSSDSKLNFGLSGVVDLAGQTPHYDLTLRLKEADLSAMKINRRDSIASIQGSVRVNLAGRDIDDLSGNITLRNVNYTYGKKSIYTPVISIVGRNSELSKFIELKSEFLDMTFSSKTPYANLVEFIKSSVKEYIPYLYSDKESSRTTQTVAFADNYSTLKIECKEIEALSDAIYSDFRIADYTTFNFMCNPFTERFSMRLKSDFIEHKSLAAADLNINASNSSDSLSMYATARNLFAGNSIISNATLMAGARNNSLELSAGFRDSLAQISSTLGLRAKFDKDRVAHITLLPSQYTSHENQWIIRSNDIIASPNLISINDFSIVNGDQRLEINGDLSKREQDAVMLTLNNYDISILTSFVNKLGYNVEGLSSGEVRVNSALSVPKVVANVDLDSVKVNQIPAPPLKLRAGWNSTENRAGLFVSNRTKQDTLIRGYYTPSDMSYSASLKADSVNMGLIDPILASTLVNSKGYADIEATLKGKGRDMHLDGDIDVYDFSSTVEYTQVDYTIPKAKITIKDNLLNSQSQRLYDSVGNSALITINLSLDQLSNVSYNVRITPENLMVLNTTLADNELFYGTLFASGVAVIKGDKRGVDMDITAVSSSESQFFMPLSSQTAVAKTDFISFATPSADNEADESTYRNSFLEKRMKNSSTEGVPNINVTMAIHATPDVDFQLVIDPVVGDIIRARGEGRLNMQITPQDNIFEMYGDYTIAEGNYLFTLLNPITKRFIIDSGSSIQWTGDPLNPILDIDAVYKLKTSLDPLINSVSSSDDGGSSRAVPVDCIIRIGDRLDLPSVNFDIEVPSADTEQQAVISNTLIDQETISQQFFYLMFANSFFSTNSNIGSEFGSSTASTGFELLTNQLSNWLSSSNYNVVIRYRPESELTSDEVDLGFSRGLIDNRLLIEVEGNYLGDNKAAMNEESNLSNFMGEAYITWLIDRAGALRLKGFTQTIDSFDENQGLQETGIGVYYQESFDRWSDLKQQVLDRFKRKKK